MENSVKNSGLLYMKKKKNIVYYVEMLKIQSYYVKFLNLLRGNF